MNNTLEIKNLTKKYISKVALENISISFKKGKIYGLLGPNGSGKTTLMKVIAGLHKKSAGEVSINNKPLNYKSKSVIVFMPTENYLYPSMKVKNIINYFDDMYDDFNSAKALELAKSMEINLENKVSELSTGLNGRLKVILAISRNADVYMYDEPLNGIDPVSREKVLKLITESFDENKMIIISSHLVSELEPCLDQVIFLKNGFIEIQGDADKIREQKGKSITEYFKEVYV